MADLLRGDYKAHEYGQVYWWTSRVAKECTVCSTRLTARVMQSWQGVRFGARVQWDLRRRETEGGCPLAGPDLPVLETRRYDHLN